MRTVWGMAGTPYSSAPAEFQYFRSDICFQVRLSSAMAFTQLAESRSSDTPRISKPASWYSLYISTTSGLALRHGPHQLAQKSISSTFPWCTSDTFRSSASGVSSPKSVYSRPMATACIRSILPYIYLYSSISCSGVSSLVRAASSSSVSSI